MGAIAKIRESIIAREAYAMALQDWMSAISDETIAQGNLADAGALAEGDEPTIGPGGTLAELGERLSSARAGVEAARTEAEAAHRRYLQAAREGCIVDELVWFEMRLCKEWKETATNAAATF